MKFAVRLSLARASTLVAGILLMGASGCGDYQASQPAGVVQATELTAAEETQTPQGSPDEKPSGKDPAEEDAGQAATPPVENAEPSPANDTDDSEDDAPPADGRSKGRAAAQAATEAAANPVNPFRHRIDIPELPGERDWINSKPLKKKDLRGKFVLFDFWTYCCINCMHVLPELKKLEHQFPNQLVVIGVHSAKFDAEKDTENILSAVLRHEVEHPVFNDGDHLFWNTLGVSSWPTIYLIDPEGKAVWGRSGEFKAEEVAEVLELALPYYRSRNLMNERPFPIELAAVKLKATPLRFPGKLLADEAGNRLFISDSNHNRIVIATLEGKLLDIIGSGVIGKADGDYKAATFNHPQGMALREETLYIADTDNHLLRKVDLKSRQVTTIAGRGTQARHPWPGLDDFGLDSALPTRFVGKPKMTALNSPWDLLIHDGDLYIAMAGPHQIWKMPLDESEIGPYAGNGREDIVDGPLLPRQPYAQGYSSFAQPSGLSSDGTWLFVADSEGSSIRAVPFDATQEVKTVVGTSELPAARLFSFGDVDGPKDQAKLQHALGVVFVDGKLYVADTYNNKIKVVDAKTGHTTTLVGTGEPGSDDEAGTFDEPAGIAYAAGKLFVADTNNHLIRVIDLKTRQVATLAIEGLKPPSVPKVVKKPSFQGAVQEKLAQTTLKPADGAIHLKVSLELPKGWKINTLAPMSYWLDSARKEGPLDRTRLGNRKLEKPAAQFDVAVPVTGEGEDELTVSLNYYYCQEGDEGLCKMGSVVFTVPLTVASDGSSKPALLRHQVAR